ncbi:apolipoprotein A-IV-like [Drosophila kikkawai]|uniref:Apolipoprotein A-IV-like n=1 Tax=Drosophila kikkawai TaxID=30033 RepID=A0ABM4GA45_DROKI
MQNFTTFFLWALFACILCQGSFAEDQSGYICLIDDPKQNQCDSYCLTELSPRLNEVVKAQNTRDVLKSKLETLEGKIGEMQLTGRLQNVENRLNGRLQGVESKLERHLQEVQTKVEAKLEKSLHEVNTKLEGQLQGVEAKLERQLRGVENKLEGQLHEVQAKLEAKLDEGLLATELRPLLGNVVQEQDTENTNDADIATKVLAKLDSMAEQQAKLEGQLQGVEAKLEGQLQEMQTKLEAKLDESLLTVSS